MMGVGLSDTLVFGLVRPDQVFLKFFSQNRNAWRGDEFKMIAGNIANSQMSLYLPAPNPLAPYMV